MIFNDQFHGGRHGKRPFRGFGGRYDAYCDTEYPDPTQNAACKREYAAGDPLGMQSPPWIDAGKDARGLPTSSGWSQARSDAQNQAAQAAQDAAVAAAASSSAAPMPAPAAPVAAAADMSAVSAGAAAAASAPSGAPEVAAASASGGMGKIGLIAAVGAAAYFFVFRKKRA